jgi:hypothetical protein
MATVTSIYKLLNIANKQSSDLTSQIGNLLTISEATYLETTINTIYVKPDPFKVGVVIMNGIGSLAHQYLKVKNAYPSANNCQVYFEYMEMTNSITSLIDNVNRLENIVMNFKQNGIYKIMIPSQSTTVGPYLSGIGPDGTVYFKQPFHIRHPNVIAVSPMAGTDIIDTIPNVWKFTDTHTNNILYKTTVDKFVSKPGTLLIIFDSDEAISISLRDEYIAEAQLLGINYIEQPILYNVITNSYDIAELNQISLTMDTLPPGSSAMIAISVLVNHSTSFTTQGVTSGILKSRENCSIWGRNWSPTAKVPLDILYGSGASLFLVTTNKQIATNLYTNALENNTLPLINEGYWREFDAFLWLASNFEHQGSDGTLRFNKFGARVFPMITDAVLKANMESNQIDGLRINPLWKVAFVPNMENYFK